MTTTLLAAAPGGVLTSLAWMLDGDPTIDVVGRAADVATAVALAARTKPMVVVLAGELAGGGAPATVRAVVAAAPGVGVLVVPMRSDHGFVAACRVAGARGVLGADSADGELAPAIRAVGAGIGYGDLADDAGRPSGAPAPLDQLTVREREVLRLIAEGHTNREIAGLLRLSINTIESHRKHVVEKLDLHNTAALVRIAVRAGLVR